MKLTISKNEHLFKLNNSSFFYLADTVWSAFTNASFEDWGYYLDYRRSQGFNVLQINILRQWDASESDFNIHPFQLHTDGSYNYSNLNEQYFDRAEQMLEMPVSLQHSFNSMKD